MQSHLQFTGAQCTGNFIPRWEGGGGAVNHFLIIFRKLPTFLQNNEAQTRIVGVQHDKIATR